VRLDILKAGLPDPATENNRGAVDELLRPADLVDGQVVVPDVEHAAQLRRGHGWQRRGHRYLGRHRGRPGLPYLVPLSLAWVDERVVIALGPSSPTARNLAVSGEARLAVGPTRDVVMIDAVLEKSVSHRPWLKSLGVLWISSTWSLKPSPLARSRPQSACR
jgi:hypothetical protein